MTKYRGQGHERARMAESFKLSVRVQPGARETAIVGWVDDVLRVRIAAPPVDGKANEALIVLIAKALGVTKSSVRIQRSESSRRKLVAVDGLERAKGDEILRKLLRS